MIAIVELVLLWLIICGALYVTTKKRDSALNGQKDDCSFYVIYRRNEVLGIFASGVLPFLLPFASLMLGVEILWVYLWFGVCWPIAIFIFIYVLAKLRWKIRVDGNTLTLNTFFRMQVLPINTVFFVRDVIRERPATASQYSVSYEKYHAYIIYTGSEQEGSKKFAVFNEKMLGSNLILDKFKTLGKYEK